MMKFILYALRWQLSTPILYICMLLLPFSGICKVIVANIVGAVIFYFVDKKIFGRDDIMEIFGDIAKQIKKEALKKPTKKAIKKNKKASELLHKLKNS